MNMFGGYPNPYEQSLKVFNILRAACIMFYEKLSPLSVPESRSPTHVPVSRNIHFRLVLVWGGLFLSNWVFVSSKIYSFIH
jgi:hypothetical protein